MPLIKVRRIILEQGMRILAKANAPSAEVNEPTKMTGAATVSVFKIPVPKGTRFQTSA